MSGTGGFEVVPIMRLLADANAALVGTILLAVSLVYDARLYVALAQKANRYKPTAVDISAPRQAKIEAVSSDMCPRY
jgi:hypothetical protein